LKLGQGAREPNPCQQPKRPMVWVGAIHHAWISLAWDYEFERVQEKMA